MSGGHGVEVQEAVQGLLERLSRERLQPLMKQSYLDCARCCDQDLSPDQLQQW